MEVLTEKMTVEEFLELELPDDATHSYELINGRLVRKNAPSGEHQYVQSKLLLHLMQFAAARDLGMIFSSPTAVVLSNFDAPQPDILFLSKKNMGKFDPEWGIQGAPDLVVEIVSPSSFKMDRSEKKLLYEAHGIREYWLVDPGYKSVEVFVLQGGEFRPHAFGVAGERVTSVVLAGFELDLSAVFEK